MKQGYETWEILYYHPYPSIQEKTIIHPQPSPLPPPKKKTNTTLLIDPTSVISASFPLFSIIFCCSQSFQGCQKCGDWFGRLVPVPVAAPLRRMRLLSSGEEGETAAREEHARSPGLGDLSWAGWIDTQLRLVQDFAPRKTSYKMLEV